MKLLLSTVKTDCFDSKLALKNMYNVVGERTVRGDSQGI